MAEGVEGIAVNGLSYSYDGASAVLSNASFTLPRGSRCLLVGRNGAGKSTLLELLAGSRMVTTRSIKVLGKDPFRESGMTQVPISSPRNVLVLVQRVLCSRKRFLTCLGWILCAATR